MKANRYGTGGRWFKGNTHIHSTASDGGKTFAELEAMYAGQGYDFLFRTDHWVASDAPARKQAASKLLWLDGIELDGRDRQGGNYHVVGLGKFQNVRREMGFENGLKAVRAQGGLLILAHPLWMGNTPEEVWRWNFDGVEVYNHVCQWLNGKGDNLAYWHFGLSQQPGMLAFAADDAHITAHHPGWNGAWIMVNARVCTPTAIVEAIRRGRYYSSCGPKFHSIAAHGGKVTVRTSPVRFARLVGPNSCGHRCGAFRGPLLTEATFARPADWPYAYVELEDARGRRAWSNTL
ncbi:MAG: hypothetical protein WCI17_08995 [bacterium]